MARKRRQKTIGGLRKSGYEVRDVKSELHDNLILRIRSGQELFPGIIGFEESVIPQIENAILSGQDMIFLGERGQAKSRIIRQLVSLLDEEVPVVAGCEINDNPYNPICRRCKDLISEDGDRVEIDWLPRERRYGEKLATPDISVADLIGEIDPIKIAEGRYLSDELAIHFGLIPRTNRGIFCINELPDLSERIQVGLFNLMEERDVQIKGYRVMLPLDTLLVASANPEDYTNRSRIITPLKDRYGAQVRTHYPRNIEQEIEIVEQESTQYPDAAEMVDVPYYIKQLVAEVTRLARRSPDINQRSGVSLRVSISNFETVVGNAYKRALRLDEAAVPRVSDLPNILASTAGKIELEGIEDGRESKVVGDLIRKAVLNTFRRYFAPEDFDGLLEAFEAGLVVETGSELPSSAYIESVGEQSDLMQKIERLGGGDGPAAIASAVELVLEGLHLNRRLNRDEVAGRYVYAS